MTKNKTPEAPTFIEDPPPTIVTDSIIAGLLIPNPDVKIIPFPDSKGRVSFKVYGDVQKALQEIYENRPIGSKDALDGIKSARGMIWNLKQGGPVR